MKELDLIYSLFEKKNDGNEKYLDDGSIVIDGVEMDMGDDEWDLEVFFDGSKSLDKFEGFWSDGYRAIKLHEIENNCIEAGRKGTGDLPMMLDTNCPWTYEQTLAKKDFLKSMNLTWLEEPIYPPEDYQTLAKLNKELGIPLACGENACTEYEFKSMIDHKAVSFVQPSVIKVGGIYEKVGRVAIKRFWYP